MRDRTIDKTNQMLEEKAKEGGILPLDFALQIMRDEKAPLDLRCEMARAAMPFLHCRRAPEKDGQAWPRVLVQAYRPASLRFISGKNDGSGD